MNTVSGRVNVLPGRQQPVSLSCPEVGRIASAIEVAANRPVTDLPVASFLAARPDLRGTVAPAWSCYEAYRSVALAAHRAAMSWTQFAAAMGPWLDEVRWANGRMLWCITGLSSGPATPAPPDQPFSDAALHVALDRASLASAWATLAFVVAFCGAMALQLWA